MEMMPWILTAGFIGGMVGFAMGFSARRERCIAAAAEDELMAEVRDRRLRARLLDEIEKQVEREAGPKPSAIPF